MSVTYENQADTYSQTYTLPGGSLGAVRMAVLRHARTWMSLLLILSDLLALTVAGRVAVDMRALWGGIDHQDYTRFLVLPVLFVAVYALRRLYPSIGLGAVEEFRRLTINTSFVFVAIAAFGFVDQTPPVYSRLIYLFAWLLALVLVPLGRALTRAVFNRLRLWGEPVAVIGSPDVTRQITRNLGRSPKIGLLPVMVCRYGYCKAVVGRSAFDLPDQGRTDACQQCPVSLARMALVVYSDYNELNAVRDKYRDTYERVILVNHADNGLGLSSVSVREFGGLTGLEIHQGLLDHWAQLQKRVIDIIGSGIFLVLLMPLFLAIAVLIYLDNPGHIFYRQTRVGKDGRYFKLLKFRTMYLDADKVLQTYLAADPALKAEWDQYQKLQHDPRITRVGRFLRRFSLDELPQLWNVFTGDMSLTGPRPIMVNQVEMYGPAYEHYVRVTPGISGLWQISGRNKTTFARRAALDVHYVMNWSIWLDIYIMVRTVWIVIRHDGAA